MRVVGFGAEGLRGERMIHELLPTKELQDYWSSRPRYEVPDSGPGPSGSGKGQKGKDGKGKGKGSEKKKGKK